MMSDPKPQYVNLNGEVYCYRESGEGDEVIILLHGLAETSKVFWRKFIPYFQKNYKIIAIDLRGHGNSEKTISGYAPEDQAQLISQIIHLLGIEAPIILGHSLGGIIAIQLAISYPKDLSKLIIYDSPIGTNFYQNLGLLTSVPLHVVLSFGIVLIPGVGNLFFRLRSTSIMKEILLGLGVFCDPALMSRELLNESMKVSYQALVQSIWKAVISQKLLRQVNQIQVPTLIIRGEFDIIVPRGSVRKAASLIPDCETKEIKNASHLCLIEEPDQFNQAVAKFLTN